MAISQRCDILVDPLFEAVLAGNDAILGTDPVKERSVQSFHRSLEWAQRNGIISSEDAHEARIELTKALEIAEKPVSEWPEMPFKGFYAKISDLLYQAVVACECNKKE